MAYAAMDIPRYFGNLTPLAMQSGKHEDNKMNKAPVPERSTRPYSAPRLIRPDAKSLSPEGKSTVRVNETTFFGGSVYGPS